ncbi:MAG TPA: amidase family protein [Solirubrobacteraceae bacterium]|nr:amidase family protein [Solirubrobacteraceae bacterium]
MISSPRRRLRAAGLLLTLLALAVGSSSGAATALAAPLDVENLTGVEAEKLLEEGKVTSVELVKAYEARIQALNKSGPGLNAVTQINPEAMTEAKRMDKERAKHHILGPAMGVPILLKDIIDATPMYTSAGDWALRESFPEKDSGVTRNLRAHGVVILGKAGLSEWANSFGSQPSGFSNLTGQVLNANDTIAGPSGSSSGSGAAGAAGLATLTIGTETGGSIISPSTAEEIVGLKPTLGLVPGFGIAPIDVSRDTAGPMEKTVADVAITLQSLAEIPGTDKENNEEFEGMEGPHFLENSDVLPAPFATVPNYSSALSMDFVKGKRIGYNATTCSPTPCTPTPTQEATAKAVKALEEAGAIMVPDAQTTAEKTRSLPSGYEAHATIDEYYAHLGASAPVKSLVQEIEVDATNPQEALKDGNSTHAKEAEAEDTPGGKNQKEFEEILPEQKKATQAAIEKMMNEPSGGGGPVIAVVGSVPGAPQAGMPLMVVPGGYTATQRRPIGVGIAGGAYDELNMIGVGYAIEQSTKLRQSPATVDPAAYRCAHTEPAEPFASRGHCNPDYRSTKKLLGNKPVLPFSLETTSAAGLEEMLEAGTLSSKDLVKAELYRIAITNAQGPAIQAVRALNPNAIEQATASDRLRKKGLAKGPLAGIPVLVNDSIDATGMATSAGSIALQDNMPASDATLVAKLKAAGAIVLGDTNVTELGGEFDPNMPQGYSSLGGQVLLPSDTNKSIGGSSAGSAAAVSVGLAPLAFGTETSTDSAQLIAPAGNAGLVGLKPTVGLVSRGGVLPVAKSQDSPGPIAQTVADVAAALEVVAGPDGGDPATGSQPSPLPSYTAGLSPTALSAKKVAVLSSTTVPYPAAVAELGTLGASTTVVTPGAAATAPSVIPYEFHRDLDAYLAPTSGPKSLQEVIDYNKANPVEGLKDGESSLLAAEAVETGNPTTKASYEESLAKGQAESRAAIDGILNAGTPAEPGDDYSALMVPSGSALVGIADRAGYPVLTVPAGYAVQNSSTGGDPAGVVFIGTAYSEPQLLADGYAFEQGMKARQTGPEYQKSAGNPGFNGAPSETNQSMWRCVLGSSFYKPYECNAGDIESELLGAG